MRISRLVQNGSMIPSSNHGRHFGAGETAIANLLIRHARQIVRLGKAAAGKQLFKTSQNGVGGLAVELLMRDGLHKRLKRRSPGLWFQLATPDRADESAHHRIVLGEVTGGGGGHTLEYRSPTRWVSGKFGGHGFNDLETFLRFRPPQI